MKYRLCFLIVVVALAHGRDVIADAGAECLCSAGLSYCKDATTSVVCSNDCLSWGESDCDGYCKAIGSTYGICVGNGPDGGPDSYGSCSCGAGVDAGIADTGVTPDGHVSTDGPTTADADVGTGGDSVAPPKDDGGCSVAAGSRHGVQTVPALFALALVAIGRLARRKRRQAVKR